ncbi:hypothetical protein GGI12_004345 [Dipsacomyces acuminosporus]|nr:hypothetical protein GGI12_004345 [Dipsacomyces acuminosporus]
MKFPTAAATLIPALLVSYPRLATAADDDIADLLRTTDDSEILIVDAPAKTRNSLAAAPAPTECPTSVKLKNPFFSKIVSSQHEDFASAKAKYPSLSSRLESIEDAFTKDLTPDNLNERYSTLAEELGSVLPSSAVSSRVHGSAEHIQPAIGLAIGTIFACVALI